MKKLVLTGFVALSVLTLTSCWSRIGKLTVISTRNMDSKGEYVLLAKDVKGKAKTKKQDALEVSVDKAVKQYPTGEFMKNCVIEVNKSGTKIKVSGDVWGFAIAPTAK
jgi:hypothetical protein